MKAIYIEPREGSKWGAEEWVQYLCNECYDDLVQRTRDGKVYSYIGHELTH